MNGKGSHNTIFPTYYLTSQLRWASQKYIDIISHQSNSHSRNPSPISLMKPIKSHLYSTYSLSRSSGLFMHYLFIMYYVKLWPFHNMHQHLRASSTRAGQANQPCLHSMPIQSVGWLLLLCSAAVVCSAPG